MMINAIIFVLFQGLAINGFQQAMEEGMILNAYRKWLKKKKSWIGKPLGLCIKCSASVGSILTFWPSILFMYGWHPFEIFAWGFDAFILISVNWMIFKKM